MKTAKEAVREHQQTFWKTGSVEDCDRWMAAEAQLQAYSILQSDHPLDRAPSAVLKVKECYAYARQIMGITNKDQFYA